MGNTQKFVSNVLVIFAVNVLVIGVVGYLLGDSGIGSSILFQLGKKGIAYTTLFQQFIISLTIASTSSLLGNENLIKRLSVTTRIMMIVITNYIITAGFILIFKWIVEFEWLGWFYYTISFVITSGISVYYILKKKKKERIEYNRCLNEYKEKNKRGNKNGAN